MSNVIKWNFNLLSCLPIQSPLSVNYSEPPVSQFSFDVCRFEASNSGYLKQVSLVWYPGLHLVDISSPSIIYTSKYYSPGVMLMEGMGIVFTLTIFLPADMVIMCVDCGISPLCICSGVNLSLVCLQLISRKLYRLPFRTVFCLFVSSSQMSLNPTWMAGMLNYNHLVFNKLLQTSIRLRSIVCTGA